MKASLESQRTNLLWRTALDQTRALAPVWRRNFSNADTKTCGRFRADCKHGRRLDYRLSRSHERHSGTSCLYLARIVNPAEPDLPSSRCGPLFSSRCVLQNKRKPTLQFGSEIRCPGSDLNGLPSGFASQPAWSSSGEPCKRLAEKVEFQHPAPKDVPTFVGDGIPDFAIAGQLRLADPRTPQSAAGRSKDIDSFSCFGVFGMEPPAQLIRCPKLISGLHKRTFRRRGQNSGRPLFDANGVFRVRMTTVFWRNPRWNTV
jgi:hypothetical protein